MVNRRPDQKNGGCLRSVQPHESLVDLDTVVRMRLPAAGHGSLVFRREFCTPAKTQYGWIGQYVTEKTNTKAGRRQATSGVLAGCRGGRRVRGRERVKESEGERENTLYSIHNLNHVNKKAWVAVGQGDPPIYTRCCTTHKHSVFVPSPCVCVVFGVNLPRFSGDPGRAASQWCEPAGYCCSGSDGKHYIVLYYIVVVVVQKTAYRDSGGVGEG